MPYNERIDARLGTVFFKYEEPSVNIVSESVTVEQETVDDKVIIQEMGRRADNVTVTAVVTQNEVATLHNFPGRGAISLRTESWSGTVIVKSVNVTFRREIDSDGLWLYDASITCTEIKGDANSPFGTIPDEPLETLPEE